MLGERFRWLPRWLSRGVLHPLTAMLPDARSGAQWAQRAKRFARSLDQPFGDRYFDLLTAFTAEDRRALLSPEILEQIELDEPRDRFRSYIDRVESGAPLNQALFADLKLFLPSNLLTLTDRMSMAHSLEVRVPYLDHTLLEFAARIPPALKLNGMERKYVLKRAVGDLLPEGFLTRRKMGFSLPLAVWFRNELRPWLEDILSERAIREAGVFRYEMVRRVLDDHFARRANYDNQIWGFVTFMTWYQDYIASANAVEDAARAVAR
jgi:asparagine synthase (glutamine-hydrolysing)